MAACAQHAAGNYRCAGWVSGHSGDIGGSEFGRRPRSIFKHSWNDVDPGIGMDQDILSGGENIVLYFGNENPPPSVPSTPSPTSSVGGGGAQPIPALPAISIPAKTEPEILSKIEPTPKIEIKKPPVKKIAKNSNSKNKIAKPSNLVNQNFAAPIVAVNNMAPIKAVEKKNTFWNFFRSIFGF